RVAIYHDGDSLGGLARGEGQRAALSLVIMVGCLRLVVGGGEVDGHRRVVGGRQAHGKDEQRRAGVTFQLLHVIDADARLVVHDGSAALAVGDGAVVQVAEVDEKGLVGFGEPVAVHQPGDRSAGLAGGDRQRAGGSLVVAAARGGAVGGGVVDGHVQVVGGRKAHVEGCVGAARVPFRHILVADGHPRLDV